MARFPPVPLARPATLDEGSAPPGAALPRDGGEARKMPVDPRQPVREYARLFVGDRLMTASWRVGLLVAGTAFVAAWLAAATTARRGDVPVAGSPAPAPPPASVVAAVAALDDVPDLAASMERLTERLEHAGGPRIGARNPFAFGRDASGAAPAPDPAASGSERAVDADDAFRATPIDRFGLVLSGIAATNTAEGETDRTAILTARTGDALLVRVGDILPGHWRVVSVTDTGVTLADPAGATRRLDLP